MRIQSLEKGTAVVELSRGELELVNNALNEVCHGIDLPEFSTRMGADRSEVVKLLHRVREALDGMERGLAR